MTLHCKVVAIYHNLFNLKFALISAVTNGLIVLWLNKNHTSADYLSAGGWQALYSFFSTGVTARLIQHFSLVKDPLPSYFFGTFTAASLTFVGSFAVHWLNSTPEILVSCLSPTLISYTTGFGTNFITRRGYMLPGNYPKREAP
jgi:hypothetical protein